MDSSLEKLKAETNQEVTVASKTRTNEVLNWKDGFGNEEKVSIL